MNTSLQYQKKLKVCFLVLSWVNSYENLCHPVNHFLHVLEMVLVEYLKDSLSGWFHIVDLLQLVEILNLLDLLPQYINLAFMYFW